MLSSIDRKELADVYNLLHIRIVLLFSGSYTGVSHAVFPVNRLIFVRDAGEGGTIADRQETFSVESGTMYFLPQGHLVRLQFSDSLCYSSIHFTVEPYPGLDLFTGFDHLIVRRNPEAVRAAADLFESRSPLEGAFSLGAFLMTRLLELFPSLSDSRFEVERRWKMFWPVFQCLNDPSQESFRIVDLAGRMGLRRDVFTRRFLREFGVPPKKFLNDQLFRKAAELMLMPQMTAREAASILGFKDEFYFSRFFKKHAGISPRRYASGAMP